jgi:dihydroflavonol-4-reductase
VLALESGQIGQHYILGGESVTMRDVTRILSELTGIPAPRRAVPHAVLRLVGRINEWISDHVTHRPPLVDRESTLHARSNVGFSSDKARKELGYEPALARVTLAKSVRWFVANGYASEAVLAARAVSRAE